MISYTWELERSYHEIVPKFRQGNGNKSEWNTKLTAQNINGRYKKQQMQIRHKFANLKRHFCVDDKALMWSCAFNFLANVKFHSK